VTTVDVNAYLRRIGLTPAAVAGPPSAGALARLHMANVERVAFETLSNPDSVDLAAAYDRIVRQGWGGTCFHLNGVFALVLEAFGYEVRMHPAGVQSIFNPTPPGPTGTHVILTVPGLSTVDNPEGTWVVDVGAGEGFHRPLPLRPGTYRQGAFTYRVRRSDLGQHCWRVDYDERQSCRGVDFTEAPARLDEYARLYDTHADGDWAALYRYGWVKRQHADGFDELIGCMRSSVSAHGRTVAQLDTPAQFFTELADTFGLGLYQLDELERDALWQRVHGSWRQAA
jgi:N-hydroxyarylamine O-acetyltransferase